MAEERVQRRLAAILAADVVGYSRLMGQDEAGTFAALRARRTSVLEPLVASHQGRIVRTEGDSFLVEFASAVRAVQCAIDLQNEMAAANADLPDERQIHFRIGINLGDIIVEGGDIYGDGVNIAARLEALAEPAGICVSGKVQDEVRGKLALDIQDLGERELKNIAKPIRVFQIKTGSMPSLSTIVGISSSKQSIAVLPFANMSGETEQQYFSDGITGDIITELSRFRELVVTARNSSFVFKDQNADVKEVGRKLGVNYVVEGSVRKVRNRVRITAELIDSASRKQLWGEHYDRELADIFEVQDDVSRTVATIVAGRVMTAGAERSHRSPTESLTAYDCYLRASECFGRYERIPEAEPLLLKAIELDPRYAIAHAMLAIVNVIKYYFGYQPWNLEHALTYGKAALALDPEEAWCHLGVGHPLIFMRRLDEAGIHVERAVALNPNDTFIRTVRANWLLYMNMIPEALADVDSALQRDPFAHDWFWDIHGAILAVAGQFEKAVSSYDRMVQIPPWGFGYLAICHEGLGKISKAKNDVERYLAAEPAATVRSFFAGEPYRDSAVIERFTGALVRAGLPEE